MSGAAWWCAAPVGRELVVARLVAAQFGFGGRVPWGAEVEYAYRAGYDSRGRVSVTHLVDERGLLRHADETGAGRFLVGCYKNATARCRFSWHDDISKPGLSAPETQIRRLKMNQAEYQGP